MAEYPDPTDSYVVDMLLRSYAKTDAPPAIRDAITKDILTKLIASVTLHEHGYTRILFTAIFSIMYHGLLRCGEAAFDPKRPHTLSGPQVYIKNKAVLCIAFKSYKHSKPDPPALHIKPTGDLTCPVQAHKKYMAVRPKPTSHYFCTLLKEAVSRRSIVAMMRKHLLYCNSQPSLYNTHSFRMGRATDMYREGASDRQIAQAGRWSSDAFMKYIKPKFVVL